jgi:hypothetical protein
MGSHPIATPNSRPSLIAQNWYRPSTLTLLEYVFICFWLLQIYKSQAMELHSKGLHCSTFFTNKPLKIQLQNLQHA